MLWRGCWVGACVGLGACAVCVCGKAMTIDICSSVLKCDMLIP